MLSSHFSGKKLWPEKHGFFYTSHYTKQGMMQTFQCILLLRLLFAVPLSLYLHCEFKGKKFSAVFIVAGSLLHWLLLYSIWLSSFHDAVSLQTRLESTHISSKSEPAKQPISGFFDPIEISPAVLPHNPFPDEPLPPMYPTFPTRYEPVLTGRCPVNFSAMSNILDKTASDCSQPLAALVGNVICCPQLNSLVHIFQGFHSISSNKLVFQNSSATYCFRDIISILKSRGSNSTIPTLCSVKPSNLTGGSCPVKDSVAFEKTVNTSKLIEACSSVDPLKECCRSVCQPAVMEAALQISGRQLTINENKVVAGESTPFDSLSDCKGVVYAYLSSKLSMEDANAAFRLLSSCKVNKGIVLQYAMIICSTVIMFLVTNMQF